MKTPEEIASSVVFVGQVGLEWCGICTRELSKTIIPIKTEDANELKEYITELVSPLYDRAVELEDMVYRIEQDDDKGLIEMGRREAVGKVMEVLREELEEAGSMIQAAVIKTIIKEVTRISKPCDPLPMTQARERIKELEGVLSRVVEMCQYGHSKLEIESTVREALRGGT